MRRAAFVLLVALACTAPLAVHAARAAGSGSGGAAPNASASNASAFGAELSGFMTSASADAGSAVDQGLWRAGATHAGPGAPNASAEVDHRVKTLRDRLDALRSRRAALSNATAASGSPLSRRVRLAAVDARIRALAASVNDTASVADRAHARPSDLEALRHDAADVARSVGSRPWAASDGGRPGDRGSNATGPPFGEGGHPGDGGASGHAENGTSGRNGTAPGENGTEMTHGNGPTTAGPSGHGVGWGPGGDHGPAGQTTTGGGTSENATTTSSTSGSTDGGGDD